MVTPTPTLPRLLAVSKDFASLDEQIHEVSHIIGLPDGWETLEEGKERSDITAQVARPRAEWVLRWALEKLKDETKAGAQARANQSAWNLLDWMLRIVHTSRAATKLREANFTSILEKTLQENNERTVVPIEVSRDARANDVSESSETAREEPVPSRKRKQPSARHSTPSKRQATDDALTATQGLLQLSDLFIAITTVTRTLTEKADNMSTLETSIQAQHVRMALMTDSAQAARILNFWLTALHKVLWAQLGSASKTSRSGLLSSLSYVLQVWELRSKDADDVSGASAEHFSTECLIASLTLHDKLKVLEAEELDSSIDMALQSLEMLLASHVLAPSRSAFSAAAASPNKDTKILAATFTEFILPLRAKIEQAAEIQDASEPLPTFYEPLFRAIPNILELAIKCSSSRTHKSRATRAAWIESVFVSLMECAGCSLEEPKHIVHRSSIETVEKLISTLTTCGFTVKPSILQTLFWFHSGMKSPSRQEGTITWSLVAALVKLDPNLFLSKSTSAPTATEMPDDLALILFDQISSSFTDDDGSDENGVTNPDLMDVEHSTQSGSRREITTRPRRETVIELILVPIMEAFARNRDLLGFIHRWDAQLCQNSPTRRTPLRKLTPNIWRDRKLILPLKTVFEDSLTSNQIVDLFKKHAKRLGANIPDPARDRMAFFSEAFSSTAIINAIIECLEDDETITRLRKYLRSALQCYAEKAQDKLFRSHSDLELLWMTTSQLLVIMWPVDLHGSGPRQEGLLQPLVKQALKDVSVKQKQKDEERINSKGRSGAFMFLLTVSDHLRTVEGWDDLIQRSLPKALEALSTTQLEMTDLSAMIEVLCVEFPHLLEFLGPDSRTKYLPRLLSKIGQHTGADIAPQIVAAMSQHFFTQATPELRSAYCSALLTAVKNPDENDSLVATTMAALLQINSAAISRSEREEFLNIITNKLQLNPRDVGPYLSIMNHLMQVSNSTANISVDGKTIFAISQSLHEASLESISILEGFQQLVRLTLHHLLVNEDQERNKAFLTVFRTKLSAVLEKPRKCTAAKLAILRATTVVQKDSPVVNWSQYLHLLDSSVQGKFLSDDLLLDALNEISSDLLSSKPDVLHEVCVIIRNWISLQPGLEDVLSSSWAEGLSTLPLQTWLRLHKALATYRLYRDTEWFLELSAGLLKEDLTAQDSHGIIETVSTTISSLSMPEKLKVLSFLTKEGDQPEAYHLLRILVSNLEDGQAVDDAESRQQLALVYQICTRLSKSPSPAVFNALLDSVDIILNEKPWLISQSNIEVILTTLYTFTSRSAPSLPSTSATTIYGRLCRTSGLILKFHRNRLGGRFHLLLPLLQNLLLCLFIPNNNRGNALPLWLKPSTATLTPANAAQYTRLLSTLCSPTLSSVSKSHHSGTHKTRDSLNDSRKAAREYVAQHIYPLLSSFSRFQLNGRLDPLVRDKLMPGIWEVIDTANLNKGALKGMYAGMDQSSADVWKGVWEEWQRMQGRSGEE